LAAFIIGSLGALSWRSEPALVLPFLSPIARLLERALPEPARGGMKAEQEATAAPAQ
jgi:hypothetical protein